MLRQHSRACGPTTETHTLICWRTSQIVIGARRHCKLLPSQKWDFVEGWYVGEKWKKQENYLVDEAKKILEDDIAASSS